MLTTKHDLPAAYSKEIGRIIVKWAYLETQLQNCIYIMMGVDDVVGRVAIREPRVAERLTLIEEIAHLRGFPLSAKTMKALKKNINQVYEWRNLLAHSTWVEIPKKGWHIRRVKGALPDAIGGEGFDRKRKFRPEAAALSLADLRFLVTSIEILIQNAKELEVALKKLFAAQLSEQPHVPHQNGNLPNPPHS